jgi:hypothetical protein
MVLSISAVCWKDKWEEYLLIDIHQHPPPHQVIMWVGREMRQNYYVLKVTT